MTTPNVIHPKTFKINDIFFQVVSFGGLSDDQAAKIATRFYQSKQFKKSDKGKTFKVLTTFDKDTANYL